MCSISRPHRRAAILLAASTLLGAGVAHAADPVKIGYLIPLSGSAAASIGKDMSRATHLAVKHINEAGGIKPWAAHRWNWSRSIRVATPRWRSPRSSA